MEEDDKLKINFIITTKCNLNCIHCLQRFPNEKDIDLNLFRKILNDIKRYNYDTIGITGGEPIFHPKFNEILHEIISKNYLFSLVTNGTEYSKYKNILQKLVGNIFFIGVSLDGCNESTHDLIRSNNSFKKAISAIKTFSKMGIFVKVLCCLNKLNKGEIEKIAILSEKLGASSVLYSGIIPTKFNKNILLSEKDRIQCVNEISSVKEKLNIKIEFMTSLFSDDVINFCNALDINALTIGPSGEIIFCCDTIYSGAVIDYYRGNFDENLIKALCISQFLKRKRIEYLSKKNVPFWFKTCEFCNKMLSNYIRY